MTNFVRMLHEPWNTSCTGVKRVTSMLPKLDAIDVLWKHLDKSSFEINSIVAKIMYLFEAILHEMGLTALRHLIQPN